MSGGAKVPPPEPVKVADPSKGQGSPGSTSESQARGLWPRGKRREQQQAREPARADGAVTTAGDRALEACRAAREYDAAVRRAASRGQEWVAGDDLDALYHRRQRRGDQPGGSGKSMRYHKAAMPRSTFPSPCAYSGCPDLSRERYCRRHRGQGGALDYAIRRDDAGRRVYRTKRWERLSRRYRIANPLCERCLEVDRFAPARVVHHRQAIKAKGDPYDTDNLEALCHRCHAAAEREIRMEG